MKILSPTSRPAFGALFNDLSGTLLAAPIRRLFCRGGSAWSDPERGTTAPDSYLRCGRSGSRGFENTCVRDSRPRHLIPGFMLPFVASEPLRNEMVVGKSALRNRTCDALGYSSSVKQLRLHGQRIQVSFCLGGLR